MLKNKLKKSFSYVMVAGLILQMGLPATAMDERFQCKVPRNQEIQQNIQDDANQDKQESFLCKAKRYATAGIKDLCLAYGINCLNILSHELGHAIAAKILCNPKETHVYLGPMNRPAILSIGNLHVTSLFPQTGATTTYHIIDYPWWKKIVISAAGPIIGAATTYYCFKKLIEKYPKLEQYPISKLSALVLTGNDLLNFYPIEGSDGMKIKQVYEVYKQNRATQQK